MPFLGALVHWVTHFIPWYAGVLWMTLKMCFPGIVLAVTVLVLVILLSSGIKRLFRRRPQY